MIVKEQAECKSWGRNWKKRGQMAREFQKMASFLYSVAKIFCAHCSLQELWDVKDDFSMWTV